MLEEENAGLILREGRGRAWGDTAVRQGRTRTESHQQKRRSNEGFYLEAQRLMALLTP